MNRVGKVYPWRLGLVLPIVAAVVSLDLRAQVFVEDSPAAGELLFAAEERLNQGEPEEAAKAIQKLLEQHGTKLLELEPGRFSEARRVVAQRLVDQPELLTAYQQIYGSLAVQGLEEAGTDRVLLAQVFHRYGLTEAGLHAALRLAGVELEAAQADTASVLLTQVRDHPALAAHHGLWLELRAVAALLLDDRAELLLLRASLEKEGTPEQVASLDRLSRGLPTDSVHPPTLSPLDVQPAARLPEQFQQPLWEVATAGAEEFIKRKYPTEGAHLDDQFERGRYLNVAPFIFSERLLLNDGQSVAAVEPASGRLLWRQTIAEDDAMGGNGMRYSHNRPDGLDLSCVAATNQHVVAIGGFGAMSSQYPFPESPSSTWLACLDSATGKVLWSRKPEEVADDLLESFWYGRPVISEGRIYVTLRRRQRTQFQDTYVAALDLSTGKLLWRRHLGSVAITNKQVVPAYVHIALDGGWLYVDTRLGSVARLSAMDGAVDWLSVFAMDTGHQGDQPGRAFEAGEPILVSAGLVVLDEQARLVRVINPRTGVMTDKFTSQKWDWPSYLVRLKNGDILSVGQKLRRIDGVSLAGLWEFDTAGEELRGRVAVTEDFAFVPTAAGLLPVGLSDGHPEKPLPIAMPANVLIRDGQLIVAHRGRVSGYSTWAMASRQLRDRAQADPDDPRPMLDLAWLSLRTGHKDSVLESLDAAITAAASGDPGAQAKGSVFDSLAEMAETGEPDDTALKQALFDRMALVASGPRQEVAYRMRLARFHESQGRAAEGVEQYQLLLADDAYRSQTFVRNASSRPVSVEVVDRLASLLSRHGREVYAPYDAYASERLEELSAQLDPEPLIELAESHPLAHDGPKAMLLAASRVAQAGRAAHAVALLRRTRLDGFPEEARAAVFAQEVELLEQLGEMRRAASVLRLVADVFPGVPVRRNGEPINLDSWAQLLQAAQRHDAAHPPRFKDPLGVPTAVYPARLMRPLAQDTLAAAPAGFVLRWSDRVEFRGSDNLTVAWSHPIAAPDVELLSMDRRRVYLWSAQADRVDALDTTTGQVLWTREALRHGLQSIEVPRLERGEREDPARQVRNRFVRQRLVQLIENPPARERQAVPRLMFAANDVLLAAADGEGRVITLDAQTGETRWQGVTHARRVTRLLMNERSVVLAGVRAESDTEPLVCTFDAQTGTPGYEEVSETPMQQAQWLGLADAGRLIHVSHHAVRAIDLTRGRQEWEAKPGVSLNGEVGVWLGEGRVVVQTQDEDPTALGGDLIWIDLADGVLLHRQSMRGKLTFPVNILGGPDGWLLVGADSCIALKPDLSILWKSDSLLRPGRFLAATDAGSYRVVLTLPQEAQALRTAERRLLLWDRVTGVLEHDQPIDAPGALTGVETLGDRLLLTGDQITAVFAPNN